jgi:hypothetical protein
MLLLSPHYLPYHSILRQSYFLTLASLVHSLYLYDSSAIPNSHFHTLVEAATLHYAQQVGPFGTPPYGP